MKYYQLTENERYQIAFIENQKLYYYHLDHLGTPQEVSDHQGNIVWSGNYRAYGSLAVAQENAVENHLRFQGQYFDDESGLHYNRFRYYDPQVGRFINQDPIGLAGGMNNYQYVPNPVSWIDPFGLTCKDELKELVSTDPDRAYFKIRQMIKNDELDFSTLKMVLFFGLEKI